MCSPSFFIFVLYGNIRNLSKNFPFSLSRRRHATNNLTIFIGLLYTARCAVVYILLSARMEHIPDILLQNNQTHTPNFFRRPHTHTQIRRHVFNFLVALGRAREYTWLIEKPPTHAIVQYRKNSRSCEQRQCVFCALHCKQALKSFTTSVICGAETQVIKSIENN